MVISKIYSNRKSNRAIYSNLIYEWEDDYANDLKVPIKSLSLYSERILKIVFRVLRILGISSLVQTLEAKRNIKSHTLMFHLYPKSEYSYYVFSNVVPIIIDFDKRVDIKLFERVYRNCSIIMISSYEAYIMLLENGCSLNIVHQPLGLSDKYVLSDKRLSNRVIDVVVTRSNPILMSFLEEYSRLHSDFEYVVRTWENNALYRDSIFLSNKRGSLGSFMEREKYLELLRDSKVALYATPGIDDDEDRFINHVTPSLFEFIVSGCRVISRYPLNNEIKYFKIDELLESVESYERFEGLLTEYLSGGSNNYLIDYERFLETIYSSTQIKKLRSLLLEN